MAASGVRGVARSQPTSVLAVVLVEQATQPIAHAEMFADVCIGGLDIIRMHFTDLEACLVGGKHVRAAGMGCEVLSLGRLLILGQVPCIAAELVWHRALTASHCQARNGATSTRHQRQHQSHVQVRYLPQMPVSRPLPTAMRTDACARALTIG